MNEKEFYKWLKSFLETKDTLTEFDVLLIKHKMENYVIVDNLTSQPSTTLNDVYIRGGRCKFPNDCGLVVFSFQSEPYCNKCGYKPLNHNI